MTMYATPLSDGSLRQCCECYEMIPVGTPIKLNKHKVEMHAVCPPPPAAAAPGRSASGSRAAASAARDLGDEIADRLEAGRRMPKQAVESAPTASPADARRDGYLGFIEL